MCRRVQCSSCGKPGYVGCGAHVEQVLADVPREDRCQCRENRGREGGGGVGALLRRLLRI
jgi:hypothetical protein